MSKLLKLARELVLIEMFDSVILACLRHMKDSEQPDLNISDGLPSC